MYRSFMHQNSTISPGESTKLLSIIFLKVKRKELQAKSAATEAIRDRAGLAIELLDEIPEDAQRAKMVEFGPDYSLRVEQAHSKPLFPTSDPVKNPPIKNPTGKTKAQIAADATRERLQSELRQNTRARVDPFLVLEKPRPSLGLKLLKRKQADGSSATSMESDEGQKLQKAETKANETPGTGSIGLVQPGISLGLDGYDSEEG